MRELDGSLAEETFDTHGSPQIHRHLHRPRLRGVRVDGRVRRCSISSSAASRRCPSNATLVLKVGGDLVRSRPDQRRRLLPRRRTRPPSARIVENLRKAKVDARVVVGAAQADGLRVALLGQGAGDSRRGARLQEVGQAGLRLPRIRRRPRVLPGDGGRPGVPDAVEPARSATASRRTRCFCAARSTRSARIPTCTTSATTRPPSNQLTEKGYTRAHKEMDESLNRDLYEQLVRGIADGRKKNDGGGPHADRRGSVPAEDALRAGLVDDVAYEDQVEDGCSRRRGRQTQAGGAERAPAEDRRRRLRARQRVLVRVEPRAAHRRHLRHRHDQQRQERLRPAQRRGRRIRHAHRGHPPGAARQHRCARSCCASTAPADRRRRPTRSGAS